MSQGSFPPPDQGSSPTGELGTLGDRAIVSVAFPRVDFNRVIQHAAHANKKTSEFIREAALQAVTGHGAGVRFSVATGSAATIIMSSNVPSSTYAPGSWHHSFDDRSMETY
tara:strand:- start:416 stop:748 length:333 start_codon:yes stop_codon:yes gene_type:complete